MKFFPNLAIFAVETSKSWPGQVCVVKNFRSTTKHVHYTFKVMENTMEWVPRREKFLRFLIKTIKILIEILPKNLDFFLGGA